MMYPKLHNAAWPGVVGKDPNSDQPPIDLNKMLDLTAAAEVNGTRFDGLDLFLFDPHVSIDATDDELKDLADRVGQRDLVIGTVVAPVWPPTGGGSSMGTDLERRAFLTQVQKACRISSRLRELKIRPYGVVRIDSACGPDDWAADPEANQAKVADTFRQACDIAVDYGERLAAEGEICWGGMHSWRKMADLLERVERPEVIGFQADMAHSLLYLLGFNAPEDRILPEDFDWSSSSVFDQALRQMVDVLQPWMIDFHVAQNDATVFGSGSHDKTGRHCLPNDPNGKLDIARHAGFWLRDQNNAVTRQVHHICWDGCMFPNEVMMKPDLWNDVLSAMLAVQDAHGWDEN